MICWVCRSPMIEGGATAAATGLPRHLRANEGSRIHLRCHGEWKNVRPAPTPSPVRSGTPLPAGEIFLYAKDIASLRGISVRQARRWLATLAEQHGCDVVGSAAARRGTRRFTSEAALANIAPRAKRAHDHLADVVTEIIERLDAIERRLVDVDATAAPLCERASGGNSRIPPQ